MISPFLERARAVLAANDRGGYTVPTDRLYPFQWNWDSAFVAMGFATFDIDRALSELEALARGQWADGMIPQIIFHKPAETYFPGPDVWRTNHSIPTSGITQPPVFALALDFIAERAGKNSSRALPPSIVPASPTTVGGKRRATPRGAVLSPCSTTGRRGATTPRMGCAFCPRAPDHDHNHRAARSRPCRCCHAPARRGLPALYPSR